MRRPLRRLRTMAIILIGGLLALTAIQLAGAGDAAAATTDIGGAVLCTSDGSYSVDWTFTNSDAGIDSVNVKVNVTSFQPSGASLSSTSAGVAAGASAQFVETGIDGTSTGAALTVHTMAGPGGAGSDETGTVSLNGTCSRPTHTAIAPTGLDADCTDHPQPTIMVPIDGGVTYALDGATTEAGAYPVAPGAHTVTASSTTLTLDAPTSFDFELHAASGCTTVVTPDAPVIVSPDCASGSAAAPVLTVATTPGIAYSVSAPAPYAPAQTVVITATAAPGDVFQSPASLGWIYVDSTHEKYDVTFSTASGCLVAVPVAPTFADDTCSDFHPTGPTYTIPSSVGVAYLVGGTVTPAGTYPGTDRSQVTVTVRALPGYVLPRTITFNHRFAVTPMCRTRVVAAAPVFSPTPCTSSPSPAAPTYTIPSTAGVVYSVNGAMTGNGSYSATLGRAVTVTASPQPGYVLIGTTVWSHRFAAWTCLISRVPARVHFADASCAPGQDRRNTFRVPDTSGVIYRVSDQSERPGVHAVGQDGTVIVTAQARPGYVLVGRTTFSHVFRARGANCGNVGANRGHRGQPDSQGSSPITTTAPVAATDGGLASTGEPVQELVLAGLALLLMGMASYVGAAVRRPGGRRGRRGALVRSIRTSR